MSKTNQKKNIRAPQEQERPGAQSRLRPLPITENDSIQAGNKLLGKIAMITGGDSGIGRAIACLFAKEGAHITIVYLEEHKDAKETKRIVEEKYGRSCLLIRGDIGKEAFCKAAVKKMIGQFGTVDIL